jgi:hypothetical protein
MNTPIKDAIREANATMFLDSVSESCEVACPACRSSDTTCVPDAPAPGSAAPAATNGNPDELRRDN